MEGNAPSFPKDKQFRNRRINIKDHVSSMTLEYKIKKIFQEGVIICAGKWLPKDLGEVCKANCQSL